MIQILKKPFAAIKWADAHCVSGTTELAEHEISHKPAIYTKYGFILRQDAVGITLATELSESDTYRSLDFIPAGMIIEIQFIKLSTLKVKKCPSGSPSSSSPPLASKPQTE